MNPIAPYFWEAQYATGHLRQWDRDGWHTSRDIDRAQLRRLVITGHPASPIVVELPVPPPPLGMAPDEVLVRATTELQATLEVGSGPPALTASRWTFVGVRYGTQAWVCQIDPAAHVSTHTVTLPAGAPLDPVPCARCGEGRR